MAENWRVEMELEHYRKYEALAQKLGIAGLVSLVPADKKQVKAALSAGDTSLNTIPLRQWDNCHFAVRQMASRAGAIGAMGWSLSDSVCVLKHVARYHFVK